MADDTSQQRLDAYNAYVEQMRNSNYANARFAGHTPQHVMTRDEWAMAQAQQEASGAAPAGAAASAPSAANEAAQRAGTMPVTGSTGLIGFDGTKTMTGAPTDYTPYLTTTSGGTAKGGSPGYSNGMEYTAWQDQSEQSRIEWKQALWYAGYYKDKRPVLSGDIDPDDVDAMKQAMGLGNLNGKSWQDAIAPRVALGQQQGGAYTGKDATSKNASGTFDQAVTQLRQFAEDNGINLTEDFIGKQAQAVAAGTTSWDEVTGTLRDKYVAPAFPSFAEQIKAGQSVKDLAAPYTASMAKLLEIPESEVKVSDPMIQQAIQAVDEKGNAAAVPLWQFEKQVKADSRYQYTSNAWNDVGQQAYKVMQMFGLQG